MKTVKNRWCVVNFARPSRLCRLVDVVVAPPAGEAGGDGAAGAAGALCWPAAGSGRRRHGDGQAAGDLRAGLRGADVRRGADGGGHKDAPVRSVSWLWHHQLVVTSSADAPAQTEIWCFSAACSLRLYGSCLTRFAFKTSDINVDVTYPSTVSLSPILFLFLFIFHLLFIFLFNFCFCFYLSFCHKSHYLPFFLQMTQPEVLIQVLGILKNRRRFFFLCFILLFVSVKLRQIKYHKATESD